MQAARLNTLYKTDKTTKQRDKTIERDKHIREDTLTPFYPMSGNTRVSPIPLGIPMMGRDPIHSPKDTP